MKLTTKELLFISHACNMPEGIFDFDNYAGKAKDFKEFYGLEISEIDDIVDGLKVKVKKEINK